MRTTVLTLIVLVAAGVAVSADDFSGGRWIDLTHRFSKETIYWPTARGFERTTVFEGMSEKGYYYSAYDFSAAEHGGTHVDAPVHFAKGRWTVDEIPLERLIGPAVVVDVRSKATSDRDYQVRVSDLVAWEKQYGKIPDGGIVLLNTGSDGYWPDRVRYMGTDGRGEAAVANLHFPGLHPEAAKWLTENRSIHAIGLDTPSIDYGQSTLFESHRVLFEHNVPAFENVANLGSLPATGATVIALPMKIGGGSGGPLRIIAFLPGG